MSMPSPAFPTSCEDTVAIREHGLFRKCESPSSDVAMGSCYVYHTSVPGVDTGVLIEFEGTLYLSNVAIREMAEVAGMSVCEEGEALERDLAEAQHTIEQLRAEKADLVEQLDAVSHVIAEAARERPKPKPKPRPAAAK